MSQRKIIHIDMDCFYAAVEVKQRPHLKGKPIGVGGPPNTRSVLTTASYEARKFKVKSAMPVSQALRLCPDLVLIPPNFHLYKKESRAVREILERYTSVIQPLSLDEAFLDVTDCTQFGGSATLIAQDIRSAIERELNLTASAGIAQNKFLAKIASDWNKPNGQFVIKPGDVEAFVRELPIEKIHGVGKVTAQKMHDHGIRTCADLQKHDVFQLAKWFGSWGPDLYNLSRGIDDRPVRSHSERKSLTTEETFNVDRTDLRQCLMEIPSLYESWEQSMVKVKDSVQIRGFVVKVKYHDFQQSTHEISSREWPTVTDFNKLLTEIWDKRGEPVRLIGVGVRLAGDKGPEESSGPQLSFAL